MTSWAYVVVIVAMGLYAATLADSDLSTILTAVTALVVASMVRVAASNAGNRFTTGLAVAAAVPMVLGSDLGVDLAGAIAIYAIGLAIVWTIRYSRGEGHADLLPTLVRRFAGYVVFATSYAALRVGTFAELSGDWRDLFPFAVALAAWIAVEVVLRALLVFGKRELSRGYLARSMIHDMNVFLGLAMTGALFGELWPEIGWWALPIALLPYSFAHLAFRRFQETKVTYKQTIRALARIPEVSGLGIDGHADRTTELATAIGKEIGLGPVQVEDVEYAGLMHDIGRVSLNEPQILRMGYSDDDLARWSSEIIAESPYLSRVATHVRHQYEPYRKPGEQTDPDVSMVSRIIKVAAAYDWQVHQDGLSPLQALENLHAGAAYEYDPEIVASLRRLLESRGVLTPVRV
ncbi:MAG TPA: HD domain-containing phosphohydrolase [Acidimicrobiia bacterium]|nr:HD domain-containing phosphohydrolase [Acidimicrobiia bacterium]